MDTSKYKGKNGVPLKSGLFYERNNKDAPYSLREEDFTASNGKTYESMAVIYRNSIDEYDAAMKLLGSWHHWEILCSQDWFINGCVTELGYTFRGLSAWREEMRRRDECAAKQQLIESAQAGNVTAQRYLHERASKGVAGRTKKKQTRLKPTVDVASIYKGVRKTGGN